MQTACQTPDPLTAATLALAIPKVLDRLRTATATAARDLPDLSAALDLLRGAGVLRAVLPSPEGCGLGWARGTAHPLSDLLRRIGSADLALARLVEGHVNAALLVEVHGERPVRDAMRAALRGGALLGVWGADGPEPLEWVDRIEGGVELRGRKRFASGLGHVDLAVVTARAAPGAPGRMFLVPADDPARHDHDAWTASAMRATRSGGFDATGIVLDETGYVGRAGDLMTEPWFEGGVWRYCAAHVGGAEGLISRWTEVLQRMGRLDDPVQRDRLGRAMAEVVAARAVVEAAARAVEEAGDASPEVIERAVAHGLLAREAVEGSCIRILALCERSLGMGAQDTHGPVDLMRRDLSLFLRQAAPDAKLDRALSIATDAGLEALR
ncbi:alkylation response protein AidB-like acyl-CoA dehydrogenase [Palleronia aestuarii]|uniref:Alkylation response protein AidB-like acyl-CoA dehydrogenase n=1 Tax=Palleronia aestuarii TaxID=568105 RepID=A0A2W7Q498_9RHOB|nr:acyl-CoA dehydrogenase [Palleronia aestuarii]PZX16499.1 alkylation response protein AidB-like acyl-CoA dehydrogenase [Palleronia aestuarii]